jgi:hypothetical protein
MIIKVAKTLKKDASIRRFPEPARASIGGQEKPL